MYATFEIGKEGETFDGGESGAAVTRVAAAN